MTNLTLIEMKTFARKFLAENYNIEMNIPLEINARLRTTCGRFRYYKNTRKSIKVEMNKFFTENHSKEIVLDVLKHELVHYALFEKGIPHRDGAKEFEAELKRLGVVSQSNIDKYTLKSKPVNSTVNIYACNSCDKVYKVKRALKNDGRNHRCQCKSSITYKGKQKVSN